MTRKEITRIYYYNKEIEALENALDDIETGSLQSPKLDGMPKAAQGKSNPTEERGIAAADLRTMIEDYKRSIEIRRKEIYEYITQLDDPLMELIIMYRCINLCTWDQVAAYVGGQNTADSVRMAFNRHFEEQEKNRSCS